METVSAAQAARILGVTQCAVYQATSTGRLVPVDSTPRRKRYSVESLERYRAEVEAYRLNRIAARQNGKRVANRWNITLDAEDLRALRAASEAIGIRSMSRVVRMILRGEARVVRGSELRIVPT